MERTISTCYDASSFYQSCFPMEGHLCHCNSTTILLKSWTDKNPGKRFYKCEAHGFFTWADKDKPNGWQKLSLLEARDQIRRQKQEIKELKEALCSDNQYRTIDTAAESTLVSSDLWKKTVEEKMKLEMEVLTAKEKEKLLRQFVVVSWGGFIVVTSMILKMLKN